MVGWCDGTCVLGKLSVPGLPNNLDYRRARVYCTCSRCGRGCLDIFCRLSFLSSYSFSLGDGPIKTEILSEMAVKLKTTNQPTSLNCWIRVSQVDIWIKGATFTIYRASSLIYQYANKDLIRPYRFLS